MNWVNVGINCVLAGATAAVFLAGAHAFQAASDKRAAAAARLTEAAAALEVKARAPIYMRCIVRTCEPGTQTGAMIMDNGGIIEVEMCPDVGRVAVCGPVGE